MFTQTVTESFEVHTCINCGVHFAPPAEFMDRRRGDEKSFYCPNGHPMAFVEGDAKRLKIKTAEAEQLRQKLIAEQDQRKMAESMRDLAETKLAKISKRVQCGTCPECKRQFRDLRAHMNEKHRKD